MKGKARDTWEGLYGIEGQAGELLESVVDGRHLNFHPQYCQLCVSKGCGQRGGRRGQGQRRGQQRILSPSPPPDSHGTPQHLWGVRGGVTASLEESPWGCRPWVTQGAPKWGALTYLEVQVPMSPSASHGPQGLRAEDRCLQCGRSTNRCWCQLGLPQRG